VTTASWTPGRSSPTPPGCAAATSRAPSWSTRASLARRRLLEVPQAARFELWRVDATGERTELVKYGPKLNYCLRDLRRVRSWARVPRRVVFPACNQSSAARTATLGTSVGWADVYPWSYPQNWIDVTGRRGCFTIVHRADPAGGIWELNEANNASSITVRLPYRRGPQRCR
jgi:hypothetical protein